MAIALRAVFGQDEVSHGTVRYRVGADRVIYVPETVARYLMHNAGFDVIRKPEPRHGKPAPSVSWLQPPVMPHPHARACGYGGCEYRIDGNGNAGVPADTADNLIARGFVPIQPADRSQPRSSALPKSGPTATQCEGVRRPAAAADGKP
ncbi:MAG TPA: hypothetical protein VMU69_25455 [Bradyrhizobium sp.]|nr:hypothetical protein [Bradyrhizobium sp.]